MSIIELKQIRVQLINSINDSEVLKSVHALLTREKKQADFWDEFTDDQKAEIGESIAQADRGEVLQHEQVVKEIKTRYKL